MTVRTLPHIIAAVLAVLCLNSRADAYVCLQPSGVCVKWAQGGTILRSFLGSPGTTLLNGTTSWDENSVLAANDWNSAGAAFGFQVAIGGELHDPCGQGAGHACPNTGPEGDNPVFFADSFCGQAFGDIIELTNYCAARGSGAMINAAVFVNGNVPWNAYDGRLRPPAHDIRRVLLHEFGHALGLDHPDEYGQSVAAIMNSHESDLDRLQADDRNGLFFLYPHGASPDAGNAGCHMAPTWHSHEGWVLLLFPLLLVWYRRT